MPSPLSEPADYIVVGGGLTGCVVASRLSQSLGYPRVTLIEGGPDASGNAAAKGFLSGLALGGGPLDQAYSTEPVPGTNDRVHSVSGGKVLGGGTMLNYGGWLRGDAADYNAWGAKVGDSRWNYYGWEPWMRKIEAFCLHDPSSEGRGTSGPIYTTSMVVAENGHRKYPLRQPLKDAWAELGVADAALDKGSSIGTANMCENSDNNGWRQPSWKTYPLDRVTVLTDTLVQRVLFTSDKHVRGVEINDGRTLLANKEVILCAGAHRTPQLLMLSGIGPSKALDKLGLPLVLNSSHVGQNLIDHFVIYLAFRLRNPDQGLALGSSQWADMEAFSKCFPWDWVVHETVPNENRTGQHSQYPVSDERGKIQILTVYFSPGIPGIPIDGSHIATSTMLILPESRGHISLRSTLPKDPPIIQPNYLADSRDLDAMIHGTQQTLRLMLGTSAMKDIVEAETPGSNAGEHALPLTLSSTDQELEQRIRETGTQQFHSAGTAAMGKVVDVEGKVMGVKGLRVIDASVFPVPIGGLPQATLYALAERLADMMIHEDRGS